MPHKKWCVYALCKPCYEQKIGEDTSSRRVSRRNAAAQGNHGHDGAGRDFFGCCDPSDCENKYSHHLHELIEEPDPRLFAQRENGIKGLNRYPRSCAVCAKVFTAS